MAGQKRRCAAKFDWPELEEEEHIEAVHMGEIEANDALEAREREDEDNSGDDDVTFFNEDFPELSDSFSQCYGVSIVNPHSKNNFSTQVYKL